MVDTDWILQLSITLFGAERFQLSLCLAFAIRTLLDAYQLVNSPCLISSDSSFMADFMMSHWILFRTLLSFSIRPFRL